MNANDDSIPSLNSFLLAVSKIDPIKISVDHLLETMKKDVQRLDINVDQTNISANKARIGIFWALTISSCMGTKSVKMTGRWESVLRTMIELVSHWQPENSKDFELFVSNFLKQWVLRMFTDQNLCPNPYLRLEMLRFICMCPETYLQDANSGMQVVEGLMVTSVFMEPHHLEPVGLKMNLAYPFIKVLRSLNKYGHLHAVAAAAVYQVTNLKVGPEASFFNHIVQLLGQHAEASRVGYLSGNLAFGQTMLLFTNICSLFELLVDTLPVMTAYEVPGLAEAAAASLVTITTCLVAMSPTLQDEVGSSYFWLFTLLDNVYGVLSITEKTTSIYRVLRLNHAQLLSSLNKQVAKSGFCFECFPIPYEESTEDCPEKFIDSLTHVVMKAPVLLHSSKMVVDESTLVHLLLMSPTDPFTRCPLDHGSYSRLPELQADIVTWRNSNIEDSSIYSDVNSENSNSYEITRENNSIGNVDSSITYMNSVAVNKSDCELQKLLLQFGYSS